jgi:hypothetical protein
MLEQPSLLEVATFGEKPVSILRIRDNSVGTGLALGCNTNTYWFHSRQRHEIFLSQCQNRLCGPPSLL